jgi:hypothetical protein
MNADLNLFHPNQSRRDGCSRRKQLRDAAVPMGLDLYPDHYPGFHPGLLAAVPTGLDWIKPFLGYRFWDQILGIGLGKNRPCRTGSDGQKAGSTCTTLLILERLNRIQLRCARSRQRAEHHTYQSRRSQRNNRG